MTRRRIPMLLVAVAALVGAIVAGRGAADTPATATFSVAAAGWMPAAPPPGGLTETWFCPGVPATGVDGVGGSVAVVNRLGERRAFTAVLYNEVGTSRRFDAELDPYATTLIDLDATLPGAIVATVVEVEGGGAIVEQRAVHPEGDSDVPCTTATSDQWFFADGFTVEDSTDQIILANPYDQTVVVALEFATREGPRTSGAYSSLTVPPLSVRVVDLGAPGAGAQGEPLLAVKVDTRIGRLVVGRVQRFLGGGRGGSVVTLGSPSAREQWWFANGERGANVVEQYSIYNPTDDDVTVDAIVLGVPTALEVAPIEVPAHRVVSFDPATVTSLPEGRYAIVFAGLTPIVVERATTRTGTDQVSTSVIPGATNRQNGYLATTWYVPAAPEVAATGAIVIHNADNAVGTVNVSAVGASGPVAVPSLTGLTLPLPNDSLVIDLVDPVVAGRLLIVESTNRVFVERASPNGIAGQVNASWAVPAL